MTESAPDTIPAPTVTLRGLGLFLALLVAFIVVAPTLRHAVEQQEQLREVNAQVADARARNEALQADLARWQDPVYVQAQARDRLGFVMPGETSYRVVDPETVVGEDGEEADGAAAGTPRLAAPWYLSVWDSIQVAGETASEETPSQDARPGADPVEEAP